MPDNKYWRDASHRLTFEMFRVKATDFPALCKAIAAKFYLLPEYASFVAIPDLVFLDYRRGECQVEMAWDNWSGFMVTAKATNSESLVREIAEWLLRSEWAK